MPNTSIEEAELIVGRMLAVIRSSRPLMERADFSNTFSAGIAAGQPGDCAARRFIPPGWPGGVEFIWLVHFPGDLPSADDFAACRLCTRIARA
jgi:hypothetical protein